MPMNRLSTVNDVATMKGMKEHPAKRVQRHDRPHHVARPALKRHHLSVKAEAAMEPKRSGKSAANSFVAATDET